jgi:hypothetical protein
MEVINYSGGGNIKLTLKKCPLCDNEHEYEFSVNESVILYSALPEAYRPRDRQLVLTCPKSGNYFKIVFRVHYPFHASSITGISVDGKQIKLEEKVEPRYSKKSMGGQVLFLAF